MKRTKRDRHFVRRAVEAADLNAVRMALYQNSGDPDLAQLPLTVELDDVQREELIDKAVSWLEENAGPRSLPEPPTVELRRLMNLATGEEMSDLEFEARREQAAFRRFPFLVEWDAKKPRVPDGFNVAIVGGGFAGIVMAVQCELLGVPYVVLERHGEFGGTWHINRYPDVRVDTISSTYELSFEKSYRWSEYFARGEEVRSYLDHVASKFGVRENTRFNHDLKRATFDECRDLWTLDVDTPEGRKTLEAKVLVSATGLFANPKSIELAGEDVFGGRIVHPARWPHDLALEGKRVAVIGNGSTGIQMVGAIADKAERTYVFQRTPQWIMPRDKYGLPMEPEVHWLMDNFPAYWNWSRYMAGAPLFDTHPLVTTDRDWQVGGGQVNQRSDALRRDLIEYIKNQTGGRQDLVDRLIPDYAPFSRRPVVDNGWYRALTRDDVELVTHPIAGLTETGIQTTDGAVHEVGIIVTATGFEVEKYLHPSRFVGRDGTDIHEMWESADGPRAWIGMMVPMFPNFYMLYGPNSQPVSSGPSQATWLTIWSSFVGRCLKRMLTDGISRIEVKQAAYASYNEALDEEATKLVMMTKEGGIEKNYYVNREHGRVQVNAPWYGPVFQQMFSNVDWEALELTSGADAVTQSRANSR